MKIGLIAEDSKLPNYALMKLYAYHKSFGDEVDFALPFEILTPSTQFRNGKKIWQGGR